MRPTVGQLTRWWSDRDPWEQAEAAYEWLDVNDSNPVLGGETAADALAPWRAPESTVVHVRKITCQLVSSSRDPSAARLAVTLSDVTANHPPSLVVVPARV
jgi:hypothetical protein